MKYVIFLLVLMASPVRGECIVMLHGLARTGSSFAVMARVMEVEGYEVVVADYPSTKAPVQDLVKVLPGAVAQCTQKPVHFVTHSMGGILLRFWLRDHKPADLGRVVMLAPPNQGSELVDELRELSLFQWVNGPAGLQLGTKDTEAGAGLVLDLPPVDFDLGVIAGTKSLNGTFSSLLPGPDDGKVTVASTRVDGMRAHLELPVSHTFIMQDPMTMAQVALYLREGRFDAALDWTQDVTPEMLTCLVGICPESKDEH